MLHAAVIMLDAVDIYLSCSHSYDSGIYSMGVLGSYLSTNDSLNKDDNDNDLQIPFFFELCFNTKALL